MKQLVPCSNQRLLELELKLKLKLELALALALVLTLATELVLRIGSGQSWAQDLGLEIGAGTANPFALDIRSQSDFGT